jgi:hypothetical protein
MPPRSHRSDGRVRPVGTDGRSGTDRRPGETAACVIARDLSRRLDVKASCVPPPPGGGRRGAAACLGRRGETGSPHTTMTREMGVRGACGAVRPGPTAGEYPSRLAGMKVSSERSRRFEMRRYSSSERFGEASSEYTIGFPRVKEGRCCGVLSGWMERREHFGFSGKRPLA